MNEAEANQRTVLHALLEAHPKMLGLDDLGVAIPDPAAVEYAVTQLASDGLATQARRARGRDPAGRAVPLAQRLGQARTSIGWPAAPTGSSTTKTLPRRTRKTAAVARPPGWYATTRRVEAGAVPQTTSS